jgi:UDP-N-acetylglucosamine 2-epimerase
MAGSMNKRILLTFGTRPEAIKLASLVKRLKESAGIESQLLDEADTYGAMRRMGSPYGDGTACERIVGAVTANHTLATFAV